MLLISPAPVQAALLTLLLLLGGVAGGGLDGWGRSLAVAEEISCGDDWSTGCVI